MVYCRDETNGEIWFEGAKGEDALPSGDGWSVGGDVAWNRWRSRRKMGSHYFDSLVSCDTCSRSSYVFVNYDAGPNQISKPWFFAATKSCQIVILQERISEAIYLNDYSEKQEIELGHSHNSLTSRLA